ncbi:MAG TPA: glycine cleavage T C-terminal barrel domain-containing protein [Candidatus Udaeobacter sp.]|jgi:folate-binding protein YgfZ|nr:glycine cleavage T C-terminal barrel domain-containing protein [Candidatus Udaeobacter sp.]
MTPPEQRARGCFLDLSARTKLRVIGTDRLRFLNGQITNDPRKASETLALEGCLLNAKGKMDAHIFLHARGESFLLDADPDVRETLRTRLERYVIADDVEIEDVTEQFSVFHVLSLQKPNAMNGMVSVRRFSEPGWDIWSDTANHNAVRQQLSSIFAFVDSDAAEVMRIEQGIPRWGRELTQEIIPIEANLEERTIDYEKGCYIGQEVISRMKMSGQTNKRLCGLISLDEVRLQPAMKLAAPSPDQKEAGWITSAERSERLGKEIALGFVKRGFNTSGTKLNAISPNGSGAIPVEVVPLPFI